MNTEDAKIQLAKMTKRGIPMILAGLVFWLVAGLSGLFFSQTVILWIYLFGMGAVFPLGILISKIFKIDMFAKGNPLSAVTGMIGGIQVFFAPIVIMVFFYEPRWMPFVIGVLTGAHFFPFVWIYNSKSYLFHTIAVTGTSSFFGIFF